MASNAIGRPSKYSEDLANEVCTRIATSRLGNDAIAKEFDLDPDTIYAWRYTHPLFSEKYARAKELQQDLIAEQIIEDAQPTGKDTLTAVQRDRLIVETKKWLMSKLAPKKYGERLDLNANVTLEVGIADRLEAARRRRKANNTNELPSVPSAPTIDATIEAGKE